MSEQTEFAFIVGKHRMVAIHDVAKSQDGTALDRFHVTLLKSKREFAYKFSINYPLSGCTCPPHDCYGSKRAAAMACYIRMHRWVKSNAPNTIKAVRELREWFRGNVL